MKGSALQWGMEAVEPRRLRAKGHLCQIEKHALVEHQNLWTIQEEQIFQMCEMQFEYTFCALRINASEGS